MCFSKLNTSSLENLFSILLTLFHWNFWCATFSFFCLFFVLVFFHFCLPLLFPGCTVCLLCLYYCSNLCLRFFALFLSLVCFCSCFVLFFFSVLWNSFTAYSVFKCICIYVTLFTFKRRPAVVSYSKGEGSVGKNVGLIVLFHFKVARLSTW